MEKVKSAEIPKLVLGLQRPCPPGWDQHGPRPPGEQLPAAELRGRSAQLAAPAVRREVAQTRWSQALAGATACGAQVWPWRGRERWRFPSRLQGPSWRTPQDAAPPVAGSHAGSP